MALSFSIALAKPTFLAALCSGVFGPGNPLVPIASLMSFLSAGSSSLARPMPSLVITEDVHLALAAGSLSYLHHLVLQHLYQNYNTRIRLKT
ncbi:hypothetical protein ES703_91135 [subsurface metagenome]